MKVIGKPRPWSLRKSCPHCRSTLLIEAGDVHSARRGCYDDFETEYYVKCVVCEGEINFGSFYRAKEIPEHIKERLGR